MEDKKMSINKFNSEGYIDTTAYEALKNIENNKKKKIVFICSPFAGDIEGNTKRARRYGYFAVIKNAVPIIPHLMYPQFLDENDPEERQMGIDMGLILLSKYHEIWVFGDKLSQGMSKEVMKARQWNIAIRYFSNECKEIGGTGR
jgi:hypothetical protein